MSELIKRKVLDHGYIALVSTMGTDESIVEAARMSTGKGFISWDPYSRCDACGMVEPLVVGRGIPVGPCSESKEQLSVHKWANAPNGDLGLLDTLWRKKHATPFEMGELVIEVQAPLMVFREWQRHRTLSYNEFSARYAMMPNLHYMPSAARIQRQSTANRQGSAELMGEEFTTACLDTLQEEQQLIYEEYEYMVEQGLAKEIARVNTPVSRMSKMRAKGNLRNWFQFLNLRARPDAQWEIKEYTPGLIDIIKEVWPRAYELFEEYDLYGAHFSRTELKMLREMIGDIDACLPENSRLSGTKLKEFVNKLKVGGEKVL